MDCGIRLAEVIDATAQQRALPPLEAIEQAYHRAHPQWRMPLPLASAPVTMVGLGPWEQVTFALPSLRIEIDAMLGAETAVLTLMPQTLLLLPEERRFTIVYRDVTMVPFREGEERGLRLRLADGWFAPPPAQAS